MMDFDDCTLLRSYVRDRSEAAFAEIVRRYVNLVYFTALRQTGGRQTLAEEITQAVFTDLARKAASLIGRPVLTGWLHTSTRFAATNMLRSESRRRAREQEASAQQETVVPNHEAADWERLRPAIDEALHTLEETDREAVLLRFFEGRAFAEIGAALGLTEEAARKRVDRALDKLQRALTQRGIVSTSSALALELSELSAAMAPAAMGARIISAALRPTLPVSSIIAGAMAAVLLLGAGISAWQFSLAHHDELSIAAIRRENEGLRTRVHRLERDADEAQRRANAAQSDNARLQAAIHTASLAGVVDQEASRAAFVIDTSGSMRNPRQGGIYDAVIGRLEEILKAHPHLRFFQVFDGDGRYVVADAAGKWLRNDEAARDIIKATLRRYNQDTVSNPVPGIKAALQALDAGRDPLSRLHIFVLGDELNSQDHGDLLLAQIDELNPADGQGRRRVTISAIGFPTWQALAGMAPPLSNTSTTLHAMPPRTYVRFNRLMTELAARHGGTFAVASGLGQER